jgi:hypothetical protein
MVDVYNKELEKHFAELKVLKKKQSSLGWIRLAVILATAIIAYQAFMRSGWAGGIVLVVGISIFLFVVSRDVDNNRNIAHKKRLLFLLEDELKVMSGQYEHRYHGGEFLPPVHDYAHDLDILGPHSIYQWLQRCHSGQGREKLARNLLEPIPVNQSARRQEAMQELAPLHEWRVQLGALSMEHPVTVPAQKKVEQWINRKEEHFTGKVWSWFVPVYTTVTIASAVACIAGWIPAALFGPLFFVYFVFSGALSRRAMAAYNDLDGMVRETGTFENIMRFLEERHFESPLLKELQSSVQSGGTKAYGQIGQLKELLNRFDLRLNILVFIFVNSFLLWDVRQMRSLNRWRIRNREKIANWFGFIAEAEVLCSLAALRFNQPDWCIPVFEKDYFHLSGTSLGHPLIAGDKRVVNDFQLAGTGKVALVTGSNMAGKSTFLRSLGVNMVLAHAGAPACAQELRLSPSGLMSSMRIADNLAENTSTFYAELKKLKTIIEAVNSKRQVLVLLDEVLRGTNSLDRHIGLEALIRQFIRQQAVAVIATHDVEVAALEKEYPQQLENYHFDVQVEGEELYFDYRLKHGVCTSLNASILMKKIGIELGG